MFDIKGFLSALVGLVKRSPILFAVFLIVIVVFASAPILLVYRKIRTLPVVGSALPNK